MTMHIVVGVDESDGAADALRWALREAEVRGADVTAVLVWGWLDQHHLDPSAPFDASYDEAHALEALEEIVTRDLGDVPDGIRLQAVNQLAGPGLVLAAQSADLLVVGARGMGGFKGLLVGSVSQHCLHHAPCPVAVVKPDGPRNSAIERIVVGIDASETSRRALRWALDAARAHHAKVEAVHAWHPSYVEPMDAHLVSSVDALEQAASDLLHDAVAEADTEGLPAPISPMLAMGSATRALLDTAEGADLIVVGTRHQSVAGCLFLGSVSLQVTHHATCPVVVVPPAA
jgi:nucleotide-binding universal stress UspA family protein